MERRTERMDARPSSIRVLLVDDHQLPTDALSGLLSREPDIEVVGIAGTVAEARAAAHPPIDTVAFALRQQLVEMPAREIYS